MDRVRKRAVNIVMMSSKGVIELATLEGTEEVHCARGFCWGGGVIGFPERLGVRLESISCRQ